MISGLEECELSLCKILEGPILGLLKLPGGALDTNLTGYFSESFGPLSALKAPEVPKQAIDEVMNCFREMIVYM
ncbi:MAG: hypothetical protein CMQ41_04075 [Gammaproteobacteria bacterium]|nr:hypothetical protein [Gammaproteobacteria bacterium]